jgi:hypothetical protein
VPHSPGSRAPHQAWTGLEHNPSFTAPPHPTTPNTALVLLCSPLSIRETIASIRVRKRRPRPDSPAVQYHGSSTISSKGPRSGYRAALPAHLSRRPGEDAGVSFSVL